MAKMRKSSLLRDIILLTLGGTLAIAGAVGGVVGGTALLALSINGKSIENAAKLDLLTEDYENKNIIELIMAISNGEVNYKSLGGLAAISPQVEELFNSLQEKLAEFGIVLDRDELFTIEFEKYPEYFTNTFTEHINLASFLHADENSQAIIKYLCFHKTDIGEYDYEHPYTLKEMMSDGFFNTMIDNLVLKDVLGDIPADNYLMNAIADWHISDFTDTSKVYGLKISDIYGTGNSGIVGAIENFSIQDLSDQSKLEGLVIGSILGDIDTKIETTYEGETPLITVVTNELVDDDGTVSTFRITFSNGAQYVYTKSTGEHEPSVVYLAEDDHYYVSVASDNQILSALAKYKIGTLKDHPEKLRSSIKIGDLVGDIADDNYVLKAIANYTIDELATDDVINNLTLTEILGPIADDAYPLTSLQNETLSSLSNPDTINGLTIEELLGPVDPENTVLYALKDKTLGELSDDDTINSLTLTDLMGEIDPDNTLLYALKDETIVSLKDPNTIGGLTILTIVGQDAVDGSALLSALSDKTLDDLKNPNTINNLKISEILGDDFNYDDNAILKAFKDNDMTLSDIQDSSKVNDAIKDLKINEIIPDATGDSFLGLIGEYTLDELKGDKLTNELTVGVLVGNLNTHVSAEVNEMTGIPAVTVLTNEKIADITGGETYRITFSNDETFDYDVMGEGAALHVKETYISKDGNYYVRMKDDSALLKTIENWTMEDLKDESKINGIKVIDLLGMDEADINENDNPLIYALKDMTIGELNEANVKNAINDVPLGAFLTNADDNPLLSSLKDTKIGELEGKINVLTFDEIVAADDPIREEAIFNSIKNKKITEFATVLTDLTLEDLTGYDVVVKSNEMINHYDSYDTYRVVFKNNSTLEEYIRFYDVNHALDEETSPKPMVINYEDYYCIQLDEYTNLVTNVYACPRRTGIFKYLPKDTKLTELTTAINNAKLTTILKDDILEEEAGEYYVYPIWKFLLTPTTAPSLSGHVPYESDPNKDAYDTYTIQDMTELINNFQYWVQNATLRELNEIGILGPDGVNIIDKEIGVYVSMAYYGDTSHATDKYGDMKLPEIISILTSL